MNSVLLGLRWIRRQPLSAGMSILCLSIGLGAVAAAATLIHATILAPFGLQRAGELVVMWESEPTRNAQRIEVSLPNFYDWQRQSVSFDALAAFGSSHWPAIAEINGQPVSVAPRAVSRDFFRVLDVVPVAGRDFADVDRAPAAPPPMVISHAFWTTHFDRSPAAIGAAVRLDDVEHRVIGVMPAGFAFPDAPDVWLSVERALQQVFDRNKIPPDQQRALGVLEVLGRLKPQASRAAARDELTRIARGIYADARMNHPDTQVIVTPLPDVLLGRLGPRLWVAGAMAMIVLLFACGNVAAVRYAHAQERTAELVARVLLGASRARVARELAIESTVVLAAAVLGGMIVGLAIVLTLSDLPVVLASGLDLARHATAGALALAAAAIAAGLLVALPAPIIAVQLSIAAAAMQSRAIVRRSRAAAWLLGAQAGLAMCLVALAGGALQMFMELSRLDIGFDPDGVTVVDVSIPDWKYQTIADRRRLDQRLLDALSAMPGQPVVAGVSVRPFRFGDIADGLPVRRADQTTVKVADAVAANRMVVTPRYFEAMGTRVVYGRPFSAFDSDSSERVAIISYGLARMLWPSGSALDRRIEFYTLGGGWQPTRVVGIVEDVRSRTMERPALELYVPPSQSSAPISSYVVKARTAPVVPAGLRAALASVEGQLAVERTLDLEQVVGQVVAPTRLLATAMSVLGGCGVLLLSVGIFGAAATTMRSAWGEVAIRQALGATPLQAAQAPLATLMVAVGCGLIGGLIAAPGALALSESAGLTRAAGLTTPLIAGGAAVLGASAIAMWPSLQRAARRPPAQLLREH